MIIKSHAKQALALFGSTSPSYLILQSMDVANAVLADEDFVPSLLATAQRVETCRMKLAENSYTAHNAEPLKLTLYPNDYGYTGQEVAEYLRQNRIECEFADPNYVVFMFTPAISEQDMKRLVEVLLSLPRRAPLLLCPPPSVHPKRAMSVREALLSPSEVLPAQACIGRVLAAATVGCPPAVPIVASGEVIDESCLRCFEYYGIETCCVVKS
jgi:arginine/lysine/ornithine decarboxylase